jgi:serralysin
VDWALSNGPDGEYWLDPNSVATQMGAILSTYSIYANIKFNYVGFYSSPFAAYAAGSDITISLTGDFRIFQSYSTWGRAFFPEPATQVYQGDSGDVYLNVLSAANTLPSYAPGSAGWFLFLHEIGHALGLKHPHDDGGTGHPTLSDLGVPFLDNEFATVMSYQDDYQWNTIGWDPATPMLLDVLAMQYLYGPNMSEHVGDDTYQLYRFNAYVTIWDAGGNDTIDTSLATDGWSILLPDYQLSSLVSTKFGRAVPIADLSLHTPTTQAWLAGEIENAVGSSYSDFIVGNALANRLQGGGGDDTINGSLGIDTAVFSGAPNQYVLSRNADGSVTISGPDGVDTLSGVERLLIGTTQIAIDIDGHAGEAYRLYQAAFNRVPDIGGLGYQMHDLDIGVSLEQVASNFIASPEFQRTYGNVDNTQFLTLLYNNVLHRAPDSGGLEFHLNEFAAGQSRADMLIHFSESPENQANVIGAIEHGMLYVW